MTSHRTVYYEKHKPFLPFVIAPITWVNDKKLKDLNIIEIKNGISMNVEKAVRVRRELKRILQNSKLISDVRYDDIVEAEKDCRIYGEYSDDSSYYAIRTNMRDKYEDAMQFEYLIRQRIDELRKLINQAYLNGEENISMKKYSKE